MKKYKQFIFSLCFVIFSALLLLAGCGSAFSIDGEKVNFDGRTVKIERCTLSDGVQSSKLVILEDKECSGFTAFFSGVDFSVYDGEIKGEGENTVYTSAQCGDGVSLTVSVSENGSAFATVVCEGKTSLFFAQENSVDYTALKNFIRQSN